MYHKSTVYLTNRLNLHHESTVEHLLKERKKFPDHIINGMGYGIKQLKIN